MLRQSAFITLLFIFLASCASYTPTSIPPITVASVFPTSTPTLFPTSTPTPEPTSTPYGGSTFPRVAIFTELEPDETAAGYIRIAEVDINRETLVFSDVKLRVGTKRGSGGYHERYPPLMRWSPNGAYLAYTWFEENKGIIYIYDYEAQKSRWELELESNHPSALHLSIDWSADSNWVFIEVDTISYYILDVLNGSVNRISINKQIQREEWGATEPILLFQELWAPVFYQYDPVTNQLLQIEPKEFNPTQFENIGAGSWSRYGQYSPANDGYLFETSNEDHSRSLYLESSDLPIFELLRINGNISREALANIYEIMPSPDKSSYLIYGAAFPPSNDGYETYTSFVLKADHPMTITSIDSANGIYPFSWSPDGRSYIGYQYALREGEDYIRVAKLLIIDGETNSILKEYELNYDQVNSIYGYALNTLLLDISGPAGIDIYWR